MEVESFYGRWQFLKDKQRGPAKMIFEWRPEAGLQVHSEDTVRGALEVEKPWGGGMPGML